MHWQRLRTSENWRSTAAKRSDWPKRQLFIDSRTEADSPQPAQFLPLIALTRAGEQTAAIRELMG